MTINYPYEDQHGKSMEETVPQFIPAVAEIVFPATCWLIHVTLTNVSAGAVTVTISDQQIPAMPVIYQASIAANETLTIPLWERYCPGGITWVASAAASIVGYAKAKK